MTSTAVTETSVNIIKSVNVSKNQNDEKTESFSNVMNHTSKDLYRQKELLKETERNSNVNSRDSRTDNISMNQGIIVKQDKQIADTDSKAGDSLNDEKIQNGQKNVTNLEKIQDKQQNVNNDLDEMKQNIMKELADELDVNPEELEEAMQMLGMSFMDLMQQGNMAMLVAQVTGSDVVTALTDETFFAQVNKLTDSVIQELSQLADNLGIDIQQLQKTISDNSDQVQTEVISEIGTEKVDITITAESEINLVDEQNRMDNISGIIIAEISNEPEDLNQTSSKETISDNTSVIGKNPEEEITANKTVDNTNQKNSSDEKKYHDENGNILLQKTNLNYNTAQQITEGIKSDAFMDSFDNVRTKEIIDQIADYVKIHNNSQISEMEIQLNPEHLGNVNLQVISKNGTISAQITAGDELVRAALESQVAQLRETLQAQGLKVDAVEVTIASHEFEQNLEQNNKEGNQSKTEKRSNRKLLNLDELPDEESGDINKMTEADLLQIQMMRMGGNKLNYQV